MSSTSPSPDRRRPLTLTQSIIAVGVACVVAATLVVTLGHSSGSSPNATFAIDEPGSTFKCALDGGAPETCTSPKGYAGIAPGPHTLTITDSFTVPNPASPAFAQGATNNGSGTSLSKAYAGDVAAGDLLVGVFRASGTTSVSDNLNGAWTRAMPSPDGVNSVWFVPNAKAGATTVAVTGSSSGNLREVLAEYSGVAASSPLDGTSCGTGTSATASTGIANGTAGDLVFAGIGVYDNPITVTAGSSARLRNQFTGSHGTSADEDILSTSDASQSESFGLSSAPSGGWAACLAFFKPAGTTTSSSSSSSSTTTSSSSTSSTSSSSSSRSTVAACPSSTPNVPDGPDPFGGCFPGPRTSGVPAGTTLVDVSGGNIQPPNSALSSDNQGWSVSGGQIRLDTANAVVDGVSNSAGVYSPGGTGGTVKDSSLGGINFRGGTLTVQDSTLNGGTDPNFNAISNFGNTLNVSGVNAHGGGHIAICYSGCTITNSYLHDNVIVVGPHQNGILADGGSNNTFTHNSVRCVGTCTSDIALLLNDGKQINETASNNLIMATTYAAFCVYPGPNYATAPNQVSGITWQDNVFQRGSNGQCDSSYGPVYGWFPSTCSPTPCIWRGNRWDDGTALNEP